VSRARQQWILVVLSAALALIALDNTIVNVALPSMQRDLDAGTEELQWVVDAYSVLFAGTLLLAGALGDRFGRRRLLLIGLLVFSVGSLAAAESPDAATLILSRAAMGVGGALIMPSTLSLLVVTFPRPRERAQAIGIWTAVAGVGVAIGPIVGGALLERFSWHSIFIVNPPLMLAVLIGALLLIPESADPSRPSLDAIGGLLVSSGLIALVVTVIELPSLGSRPTPLIAGVAAVALLTAFVGWERRARRPLLPMPLFRQRPFSVGILAIGLTYFALMGAMFVMPQYLQLVLGMTPLEAGIALVPAAAGLLIAAPLSPRLAERIGARRVVVAGLLVVALALVLASRFEAQTTYAVIGPVLGMLGLGMALALPQATNAVLGSVPRERSGMGSAVNDAAAELGGSFGVAILGTVLAATYLGRIDAAIAAAGDRLTDVSASVLDGIRESLATASLAIPQLPADLVEPAREVAGEAYLGGLGSAMLIGAGLALLAAALVGLLFPAQVEAAAE